MSNLKIQKRLASQILKVGTGRVWINPEKTGLVETAITRESLAKLISEGVIKKRKVKGTSRARARIRHFKRKKRSRTPGNKKGSKYSIVSRKRRWVMKTRALRKFIKELKGRRKISNEVYRKLYRMISGGYFTSRTHVKFYFTRHGLWRR